MRRAGFAAGMIVLALAAPALAQQAQGPQGNEQPRAAAARRAATFERLDINHDGALSIDEWAAARQAAARGLRQRQARQMRQRVRRMDANRDGAIAREEWRGRPEVFDRLDADKDGKVTAAELRSARQARRQMP